MKRFLATLAVALMGFGVNAFAVEENFDNDTTFKKSETPAVRNLSVNPFYVGIHVGLGFGGYWDYPSEYLGSNEWMNVAFDLGCTFNIRVNRYLSVVPELGFGMIISSRDAGSVSYYDVSENRGAYGFKIPVTVRFNPHRQFYLETGARMSLNFASSHTLSGSDIDGNTISLSKSGNWKAKSFVPSLIFGLGGTFKVNSQRDIDVGTRFILDVGGIEKNDDIYFVTDDGVGSVKNKTKVWNIQIVVNYYFGSLLSSF